MMSDPRPARPRAATISALAGMRAEIGLGLSDAGRQPSFRPSELGRVQRPVGKQVDVDPEAWLRSFDLLGDDLGRPVVVGGGQLPPDRRPESVVVDVLRDELEDPRFDQFGFDRQPAAARP